MPDPAPLRPPRPLQDALDKATSAKPATPVPEALKSGLNDLASKLPTPADAPLAGTDAEKLLEGLKEALTGPPGL